jgi:multiple sugar transport system substrate-binding protein
MKAGSVLQRLLILTSLLSLTVPPVGAEIVMLYMAQAGYQPPAILERAAEFTKLTGKPVRVVFTEYEDMYNRIVASSKKKSADYDVILVDLIWTADFVARKIVDPVPPSLAAQVRTGMDRNIYGAFEYGNELWSFPFLANMQLLYVNNDILKKAGLNHPPGSLEELAADAEAVKKAKLLRYPIFEAWRKQEALVCSFSRIAGAFGGDLVDSCGSVRVDSEPCVAALGFMRDLLVRGLVNPYSLDCDELTAADVFLNGDAAFLSNWTYVIGRMRSAPYSGNRGLAAAPFPVSEGNPGQERTSTVSGFQGLSVVGNARAKADAWDFISFLSSPEFERQHLNEMSVWKAVWDEPRTRRLDPEIDLKKAQLAGVHNRPLTENYRAISGLLQDAIYRTLKDGVDPRVSLETAQRAIEAIP